MRADLVDSDDEMEKMITKKEMKLLAAINAAESNVLGVISNEYAKLSGGKELNLEKFVEAFRKYSPYFVQILASDTSDDSDDEELTVPSKVYRFITAFTNSKDYIKSEIDKSYSSLYKKELKELNFSIFQNHPKEIFKSYGCSSMTQSSCAPSHREIPSSSIGGKMEMPSLCAADETQHTMNANDVSLEMEEGGSLVSGQEDELRKTMESGSSTPVPTVEDWNGIKKGEAHFSSLDKEGPRELSDRVPLTIPPGNGGYGYPIHPISNPVTTHTIHSNNDTLRSEDNHGLKSGVNPTTWNGSSSSAVSHIPYSHPNESVGSCAPRVSSSNNVMGGGKLDWKGEGKKEENAKEQLKEMGKEDIKEMNTQITQSEAEDVIIKEIIDGLTDKVREDLRFALPAMMERAVKMHVKEKKAITLKQLIGENYADETLERFMMKMMTRDKALQQIFHMETRDQEETLFHLRSVMMMSEPVAAVKSPLIEKKTFETLPIRDRLPFIESLSFLFPTSGLPLILKAMEECDVRIDTNGTIGVFVFANSEKVDAELEELLVLELDHLSLSNARHIKKGTAVVAMATSSQYCRAIVVEEWKRDDNITPDRCVVQCRLIDYGDVSTLPISVLYKFPRWKEFVLPAVIIDCRIDVVPIGAKSHKDKFSNEVCDKMMNLFSEWINEEGTMVHVVRFDGHVYYIDAFNANNESLINVLIQCGLAQKEVSSSSTTLPSLLSHPPPTPPFSNPIVNAKREAKCLPPTPQPLHTYENNEFGGERVNGGLPSTPSNHFCNNPEKNEKHNGMSEVPHIHSVPYITSVKTEMSLSANVDDKKEEEKRWNEERVHNDLKMTSQSLANTMSGMVVDCTRDSSLIVKSDHSTKSTFLDIPSVRTSIPPMLQVVRPSSPPYISSVLGMTTTNKPTSRRMVEELP